MHSDQAMSWHARLLIIALAAFVANGCGQVVDNKPAPVPTTKQAYEVGTQSGVSNRSVSFLQFDLAKPKKFDTPPGIQYTVENSLLSSADEEFCTAATEAYYSSVFGQNRPTINVANVGTLRIDLEVSTTTDAPRFGACFAFHTKGGSWTWRFEKRQLIIDPGQGETMRDSLGHIEFEINANNVDLIAVMPIGIGADQMVNGTVKKLTYTASRATP